MKQSITEYPLIAEGIREQESLYSMLSLTAEQLKETLAQPQYAAIAYQRIEGKGSRRIEETVERVTGFGLKMSSAFESMITELGRVPTQAEFDAYCLTLAEDFWNHSKPEGIEWDATVATAVSNRNLRCYVRQVTELHAMLLIRELFPQWTVVGSDLLDNLMGVDIVVETGRKRLYLHVMKNSKYSFLAFRKKQKRGGLRDINGKFHRYNRDFTGDKALMYEGRPESCSDTTEFVNGLPLFKADWLKSQLLLFDTFGQFGEPLDHSKKLDYMEGYLKALKEVEEAA